MKHPLFNVSILLLTLATLFPGLTGCSDKKITIAGNAIERIASRNFPDRREGLRNITIVKNGRGQVILKGETNSSSLKSEIEDSLRLMGLEFADSISVLPDTTGGKPGKGLVTLSVINLRSRPAHSAELVSQAVLGTPVIVLKEDEGWILVQTPDSYIAWTEASSVILLTEGEMKSWKSSSRVIFKKNYGSICSGPGTEDPLSDIVAGSIVVLKSVKNGFAEVVLPDGRSGFLPDNTLKPFGDLSPSPRPSGEEIIERASMYTGIPYLWGGTSPKAVDCSGFVQSVYMLNGIILSRDASLQAKHGTEIDVSRGYGNLEKGDLLFFGSVGGDGPHVTHVAIYRGDSEFIHASSKVMINSLDSTRANFSAYRKRTLLSARRICGAEFGKGIMPLAAHKLYN